ncbi:MAG: Spy/CpxP family protein refolding chaperone [Bacteroidota bacterium]
MKRLSMRLLLLLTVGAFSVAPVFAQDDQRRGPRGDASPQERLERLADQLELTDAQRADLRPILDSHHAALQAIHDDSKALRQHVQNGDLTREEAQAQRGEFEARMQAERDALAQAAAPILDSEQRAKLTQLLEKRQNRRGDRGDRRGDRQGPRTSNG